MATLIKAWEHGAVAFLPIVIQTMMELTGAEIGVILAFEFGEIRLVTGFKEGGERLAALFEYSRDTIVRALMSDAEYIVSETISSKKTHTLSHSRSIVCVPLGLKRAPLKAIHVAYLELAPHRKHISLSDYDLLKTMAVDVAYLCDALGINECAEPSREKMSPEMISFRDSIQQEIAVQIPEVDFAEVSVHSELSAYAPRDVYDVVADQDSVCVLLANVSGKGVCSMLLCATLQALVRNELIERRPLKAIAELLNGYICHKDLGKYATFLILRLHRTGLLNYINCGHVLPLLHSMSGARHLETSNLPIGLDEEAVFHDDTEHLDPGSRILLVTDGVTEAENAHGEFFGDARLEEAFFQEGSLELIAERLRVFCSTTIPSDDGTAIRISFNASDSA